MRFFERLFGGRGLIDYSRRERMIFPYSDGTRNRRGDPLAIHRQLVLSADLDEIAKVAAVPTLEGVKARGELVATTRRAFGIRPLEEGGLLDAECLDLFVRFGAFMKKLEADSRPLPSGPTPTASPASAA
jgi:hypothetical protein